MNKSRALSYPLVMIGCIVIIAAASPARSSDVELAEDFAAALCGVLGASSGGNTGAAAGALICKYATRATDSVVSTLIDEYFEGEDQEFVDETCITIVHDRE